MTVKPASVFPSVMVAVVWMDYFGQFFQGATLVPRVLCFVKPVADAQLNRQTPFVCTSDEVLDDAKKPWTMEIEGQVLNSTFVNEAIKPLQPEGLMGARDIHRRPFEACDIPVFNPINRYHQLIAETAREARKELLKIVRKMETPVSRARGDARQLVASQLHKLDKLVTELLKNKTVEYPEIKSEPMQLMELFDGRPRD